MKCGLASLVFWCSYFWTVLPEELMRGHFYSAPKTAGGGAGARYRRMSLIRPDGDSPLLVLLLKSSKLLLTVDVD